ncbi:MAG: polymer-forming cytoskeletal protein, partial [Burkholderiales bacterium]
MLVGFIALVCVPAAALVFLLTIVGLPLALATAALYFVLLLAGYVSAGIGLGDYALARASAQRAGSVRWRVGAAMLGMLAVS